MKKLIAYSFLFIFFLTPGLLFFAIKPCLALSTDMTVDEIQKIITAPQPAIHIPGLDFTDKSQVAKYTRQESDGIYMYIPYLGEYISAVYKYAIAAAAVLVVIRIMDGGFGWIISGGTPEKIKASQQKIGQGLMGLFLAVFLYTLLYTINPELVQFRNLRVKLITPIDYSQITYEGHAPNLNTAINKGVAKKLSATNYDNIFQSFAACIGIDWRILKAIAYHESGLNHESLQDTGGTYVGLFQTAQIYCNDSLVKLKLDTSYCGNPGIYNAAVNTAIVTPSFTERLQHLKKCPTASLENQLAMLYYGHANGAGALSQAIGYFECDPNKWPDTNFPLDAKLIPGKKIFSGSPKSYIFKVRDTILNLGVTQLFVNTDKNLCPSVSGVLPN